jgi:ketosteroid isomerase-like protein
MTVTNELSNEDVVREYFKRIFEVDPAVYDLYAKDAVFVMHTGEIIEGRDEIREHIETRFAHSPHIKPPTIEELLSSGSAAVAVLEATFEDGVFRAVDVFEIEDGRIKRLSIYRQDVPGAPSHSADAGRG